jgi:hypothetical protein
VVYASPAYASGVSSSPLMRWADDWAEWYNRQPYTRRLGLAYLAFPMVAFIWFLRRVRANWGRPW